MSDPISPKGSPGQPQPVIQTIPGGHPSPSGQASGPSEVQGRPQTDAVQPQKTAVEAILLELTQESKNPKAAAKPPTLEESAQSFEDFLKSLPNNLELKADKESGYTIYKIVNPLTREVIRQYPPDQMIEMAKRIKEQLSKGDAGILLDEKS